MVYSDIVDLKKTNKLTSDNVVSSLPVFLPEIYQIRVKRFRHTCPRRVRAMSFARGTYPEGFFRFVASLLD